MCEKVSKGQKEEENRKNYIPNYTLGRALYSVC